MTEETTATDSTLLSRNHVISKGSILESFIRSACDDNDKEKNNKFLPPAQNVQECLVGPSNDERTRGTNSWNHQATINNNEESSIHSLKRKRRNKNEKEEDEDELDQEIMIKDNNYLVTSTFQHAVHIFLSSGCCIIPNVLPQEFVSNCLKKALADFELLNGQLEKCRIDAKNDSINHQHGHELAAAYRVDYREMVDRDGGRRDVRFELDKYPYSASGLIYNSIIFPLVQELLGGEDVTLLYQGIMWAQSTEIQNNNDNRFEKCPQKWHGDGGHLFQHAHQPPHCINVFFPLIDLNNQNGPTEVQPGSHILGQFHNNTTLSKFGMTCSAGDAILFDYRLKHRGGINVATQDRPILYLAYCKPWFRDTSNTRSGQSIFARNDDNNHNNATSRPWISRRLTGQAMPMGKGFDPPLNNYPSNNSNVKTQKQSNDNHDTKESTIDCGSGERWILFKMNIQLDNGNEETIVVCAGDIASEVSSQFCLKHGLSNDFIPVLTTTIQQQINQVTSQS